MSEVWTFRDGTLDGAIFNDVVLYNEYRLPSCFAANDTIIDVGTHIGSFAHAVLSRGCGTVYGIEPDAANCKIAATHLSEYLERGSFKLIRAAVWRSEPNDDELFFDGYFPFTESHPGMEGIVNTGGGSVIWGAGEPVPKLAFDELVDTVTSGGARRIRLVKLDCEGAEWPILLTSQRLNLVDEICGEFHEIGGEFIEIGENHPAKKPIFWKSVGMTYTIETLEGILRDAGFVVTYVRHQRSTGAPEGMGLFFATRDFNPQARLLDSYKS